MSLNLQVASAWMLMLLAIAGCGKRTVNAPLPAPSPDQIKELVADLSVKNPDTGMGFDLRVAAASRLAEIGPVAKEFGAVPALEKLLKNKDPKVKDAAEKALAKINGP